MRKLILVASLSCFVLTAFCQSGGKSSSSTSATTSSAGGSSGTANPIIKFDYRYHLPIPATTVIPFDQMFYLEVDSLPVNDITHVYVYHTKYNYGAASMIDREPEARPKTGPIRKSFELKGKDTSTGKQTLLLSFPALKGEKDFDVLVVKGLSPSNVKKALAINKILDQAAYRNLDATQAANVVTLNGVAGSGRFSDLQHQFQELEDSTDNIQYGFNGHIFAYVTNGNPQTYLLDIGSYKVNLYDPTRGFYDILTTTFPDPAKGFNQVAYFDQGDVTAVGNTITKDYPIKNRLYLLQKILTDDPGNRLGIFNQVLIGVLPWDYADPANSTDLYDFASRIKNLKSSVNFIDSIRKANLNLTGSAPAGGVALPALTITHIENIESALKQNLRMVNANYMGITNLLTKNSQEGIWVFGQNTRSPDLQTLGSRRFTLDAGIVNIFAYDNFGKIKSLPKLTLFVDYYFIPINKNAPLDDFQIHQPDTNDSYDLLARQGFWQKFSLSLGLTLAGMNNKSFDNVYSSFSFTLGPSYTVCRGLKLTAGWTGLKRYDANPVLSGQEKFIFATYAGINVDEDLINVISSFTSKLFN